MPLLHYKIKTKESPNHIAFLVPYSHVQQSSRQAQKGRVGGQQAQGEGQQAAFRSGA